jgi:outer membrane protein OmpA-like peptidoglycan-associated protein
VSELKLPENIATTLVNPKAYATDELHNAYRWLRNNNPLGVAEVEGFDPFWVVTKHADILGNQPQQRALSLRRAQARR